MRRRGLESVKRCVGRNKKQKDLAARPWMQTQKVRDVMARLSIVGCEGSFIRQ